MKMKAHAMVACAAVLSCLVVLSWSAQQGGFPLTPIERIRTEETIVGDVAELMNRDSGVVVSQDSRHLAYVVNSKGGAVVVLDGVRGTQYSSIDSLILSPSGRHLAYKAKSAGHQIVVLDGSESAPYDDIDTLRFSPDETNLAFVAQDRGYHFLIVNNKRVGRIYDDITGATFSADSQHVAFIGDIGQVRYLVIDQMQSSIPTFPGCSYAPELVFNAVSSEVAAKLTCSLYRPATSGSISTAQIVVVGLDGHTVVGPTTDGDVSNLVVSPVGAHFAYHRYQNGRYSVVLDGTPGPDFDWSGAQPQLYFTGDGQRVVYSVKRGNRQYVVVQEQNGTSESIPVDDFSSWNHVAFDARFTHMAYVRGTQPSSVIVLDLIGKSVSRHEFQHTGRVEAYSLTFSPDGMHIAYGDTQE